MRMANLIFYIFIGFVACSSFFERQINEEFGLIDLGKEIPSLVLDLKYATTDNSTGGKKHSQIKCFARREVAQRLALVQKKLAKRGLGLKVWDAYRPFSAQKDLWETAPNKRFVADPSKGSNYNRGAAVDVTLVKLDTGEELEMPTKFDSFSPKAGAARKRGASAEALENKLALQQVMQEHGFNVFASEWWHFNYEKSAEFAVLDVSFEELMG